MKKLFYIAVSIGLATGLCSACGRKPGDTVMPVGETYNWVSLPYIESVDFPPAIHAGEPFTAVLHLSATAHPEVLGWYSDMAVFNYEHSVDPWVLSPSNWPGQGYDLIRPWVERPPTALSPPVSDLEVRITPPVAGQRVLRVQSAESAAHGGLEGWFWTYDTSKFDDIAPGTVYRDYPYTVLPAAE